MDTNRDSIVPLDRPADFARPRLVPDLRGWSVMGSAGPAVDRRVADRAYEGADRRARLTEPGPLVERERAIVDREEHREEQS